jgi:hypothetical protein
MEVCSDHDFCACSFVALGVLRVTLLYLWRSFSVSAQQEHYTQILGAFGCGFLFPLLDGSHQFLDGVKAATPDALLCHCKAA